MNYADLERENLMLKERLKQADETASKYADIIQECWDIYSPGFRGDGPFTVAFRSWMEDYLELKKQYRSAQILAYRESIDAQNWRDSKDYLLKAMDSVNKLIEASLTLPASRKDVDRG